MLWVGVREREEQVRVVRVTDDEHPPIKQPGAAVNASASAELTRAHLLVTVSNG